MSEETEYKTPKQRYDEEIKNINKTISPERIESEAGLSEKAIEELDEEVEAVEDAMEEMDKSMGDVKETATSTMTKEQHLDRKLNEQREKVLQQFTGHNAKPERLSPEQSKKMTKVLEMKAAGKVNDPVLKYLIDKKLDLAKEQVVVQTEIKESQLEIVERLGDLAKKATECKGAVQHVNKEILIHIQKNPDLIK